MNKYVIASKALKKHEKSESNPVEKTEMGKPEETIKQLVKPKGGTMPSAMMSYSKKGK